ncbi:gag-pol polyprotein [Tanacetum coccineum]
MQTSSRQVEALVVMRGRSMEPGSSGSHNDAAVANEGRKRFADVCCNDHELKIIKIGSIMVKMHDGTVHTIRDVRYMEGALVLMRGEMVAANLYQLKGEIIDKAKASVSSHSPSHKVTVMWHRKLGHMSEQGMKILVEIKLLLGLTKRSLPFCKDCVISKQHRLKFKTSNSRSVSVLELKIKCLRTDNGGEYTSDEFDTLCRKSKSNVGNCKLGKNRSRQKQLIPHVVKGYCLWNPTAYKVVVNKDVVFIEDIIQENEEGDSTTREHTSIQMEKQFQSNDSSEGIPQHEENEITDSQAPTTCTLNHEIKHPAWHLNYVMESNVAYCLLTEEGEPSTLQEALNKSNARRN